MQATACRFAVRPITVRIRKNQTRKMNTNHQNNATSGQQRVIHVINGEHYSGAERVQDLLAQRLPEFGYDVSFACVKPGQFAALRQDHNAPIYELPMRLRIDMRPALALARIVRKTDTRLLHAHTPRSLIVARLAAMIARVPLVYHVHSPTSRDSTHSLRNWLNNATEQFSLTGIDRLITVSHSLAQHMVDEGIDRDRIVTVCNGVPAAGPLSERSAPNATWTLGTVALFRPRKGLEVLLHALAQLRQRAVPVRLCAVGGFETPEYKQSIHTLAKQLKVEDLIDWVGFTQDVARQLAQMDLFVLPSLFGEGLPMVVLEAMTAGVPVVATRVEGVPEAIRDGVDGVLAEPDDANDLQHAIGEMIEHPDRWQTMRRQAYHRHAEHFSDRRMAEQVAEIYRAVSSARWGKAAHLKTAPSRNP